MDDFLHKYELTYKIKYTDDSVHSEIIEATDMTAAIANLEVRLNTDYGIDDYEYKHIDMLKAVRLD